MSKLRFPENIVFREEPEGGILFDVDTGELRFVEKVARGICHLIDMEMTREQILRELETRYPGQPSLESDLDEFLEDLAEANMLSRRES